MSAVPLRPLVSNGGMILAKKLLPKSDNRYDGFSDYHCHRATNSEDARQ
jgi:hypothetical protein